jgi:phytoene dehydrogenase-like protein
MNTNAQNYDAIIIGSGIGGLTAASLLTQVFHKKVLLLEKHSKFGGFTHTFKRPGGYRWDVGLHYVGDMAPGSDLRLLFDLITKGKVVWTKMQDPFEHFVYPEFEFRVRTGAENYQEDLIATFPNQRKALVQYFKDIRAVASWSVVLASRGIMPEILRRGLARLWRRRGRLAKLTTGEYLEACFTVPKLRSVLASQWGDYGLPPGQSSFFIHATIAAHYLNGGYYPAGTSASIAESIIPVIKQHGGEALNKQGVTEIIVKDGVAVGVRCESTETQFNAPIVISTIGARNTFLHLIPENVDVPFRDQLKKIPPGYTTVSLYLGLSASPASLQQIQGGNYWLFDSFDHDAIYAGMDDLATGAPHTCYLSFPSLKDPLAEKHTAEIIAPINAKVFDQWRGTQVKRRGDDYEALKAKIIESLLSFVELRLPGFRSLVAYSELGTPLTNEHYSAHPHGEIYGLPATPERLTYEWTAAKTSIPGLYLGGSDVAAHGIAGALMGGVMAVAASQGSMAFLEINKQVQKFSATSEIGTANPN